MNKQLLALAAMAALGATALGTPPLVLRRSEAVPDIGWVPPRRARGLPIASKRIRRNPSRLQLRGWPVVPCLAPEGYFWRQDDAGKRLWRLHAKAPGERRVEYDPIHDRSIIWSGWGNVKPTYAPGDVR